MENGKITNAMATVLSYRNTIGSYLYANGDKYQGGYRDDKRTGRGILNNESRCVLLCKWE